MALEQLEDLCRQGEEGEVVTQEQYDLERATDVGPTSLTIFNSGAINFIEAMRTYWVLLFCNWSSVSKPLAQPHTSTLPFPQYADPTISLVDSGLRTNKSY